MLNNENVLTINDTKKMSMFFGKVYGLLSLAILSSALVSLWVVKTTPHFVYAHPVIMGLLFFGAFFLARSTAVVPVINFVTLLLFSGFNGLLLGPTLSIYLHASWGPAVVAQALLTTFVISVSLSGYVLVSKKSFSFMGDFLFTGLVAGLVALFVQIFWHPPIFREILSTLMVLLFSGFILYDTSRARENWEKLNPLDVVISLFLDMDNMFLNLLQLMRD